MIQVVSKYITNQNKKGCGFMNKSNIKFLALLSALVGCAPSLGAMKNSELDNLQTNMIKSDYLIEKPVGFYQNQKIDTFGTPELDLEAFLRSINDEFDVSRDLSTGKQIKQYIEECFNEYCFGFFKTSNYKLNWSVPFVLSKVSETDNSTIRFVVRHATSGRKFNIVGEKMTSLGYYGLSTAIGGDVWHFYAEDFQSELNKKYRRTAYIRIKSSEDYNKYLRRYSMIQNMGVLRFFTRGLPYNKIRTMMKSGDKLYDEKGSGGYNSHPYLIEEVKPNSDNVRYTINCKFRYHNDYKTYTALEDESPFYNFKNIDTTEFEINK